MIDSQQGMKKGKLPLVLAAYQPQSETFLLVACAGPPSSMASTVTNFALAYRQAAEKSRARVRHDAFDAAVVIEVASEDLKSFLKTLQGTLVAG